MKKIILISLLLASFSIAEETNIQTQAIIETPPIGLQDLGRGYAKDLTTNQIYYEGKLISISARVFENSEFVKVSYPDSFKINPLNSHEEFDAEDYLADYIKGKRVSRVLCDHAYVCYSTKINLPIACIPFQSDPIELLTCYQKKISPEFWLTISPVNPEEFNVIAIQKALKNPEAKGDEDDLAPLIYARDKNNIYISKNDSTKKIGDIDLKTFELLFYPYARDKNHFFLYGKKIEHINSIEPSTTVYIGGSEGINISPYYSINYNNYVKSDNKIYYQGQNRVFAEIEGADAETFKIIDYPYAKDKTSVYYHGKAIPNFSSRGFIIDNVELGLAHNESLVVIQNIVIDNISASEFEVIYSNPEYPYSFFIDVLLKDKNVAYHINYAEIDIHDNRILNITRLPMDPENVEFVSTQWDVVKILIIKDKNGVYFFHKETKNSTSVMVRLFNVDPASFTIIDKEYVKDKTKTYLLKDLIRKSIINTIEIQ